MDADALVAFRKWWDRRAAAEGPTGHGAVARALALVVWTAAWEAGYAAGARHENSEHLRRLSESLEGK